ncbi:ABC transporter ATP-binding protein [Plantactinospora sp. S1510]|uniref:ABC transporter ATP-binding protein n=1 Tax=Plantactinospora alkalitolerans TaxID=2789879 RepID=A0ABS0H2X7_9ACTN|nr:ABC transporter ATP-binding protein [Plantactinospora alkalitolerans]MBF9132813.1 ABC transporter ATP-binding protein [Plantactinospora alkalitolerans]
MSDDSLVATDLVKRYGSVAALDGFHLTVAPGEIVGLVGANGSGKTTFVEVVTGLTRADQGEVRVLGIDIRRKAREVRRHIGFTPQDISLYYSATPRENLRLFGGLVGLRRAALASAMAEAIAEMQLDAVLDRPVGLLSGGQQRRVQVASAMLGAPALMLLDEPTAGADPPTRQSLLAAVRKRAEAGAAIVYTTHYLPELSDLDATLAVIRDGRVVARGDQATLLSGLVGEVRVRLADAVPDRLRDRGEVVDGELRIPSADPAQTLAELLADGHVPASVDLRKPSLDDLYRALEVTTP